MKKIIVISTLMIQLLGCSKQNSDFTGNWTIDKYTVKIQKNGDDYILTSNPKSTIDYACAAGAQLRENQLVCSSNIIFSYDKNNDEIKSVLGTLKRSK